MFFPLHDEMHGKHILRLEIEITKVQAISIRLLISQHLEVQAPWNSEVQTLEPFTNNPTQCFLYSRGQSKKPKTYR